VFTKRNITAFFVIAIFGTLSHFVYEWSGNNYILGFFFPVNESTWEHLKLLFYPTLIYSVAEYFILKRYEKNYITAVVTSLLCGMFSIITIFYTYTGIWGKNIDFVNIAIYYISIIIMLFKKTHLIKSRKFNDSIFKILAVLILFFVALLFAIWSYNPPAIGLFLPPAGC